VLGVVKLFEKSHTKLNVRFQVLCLCGALHENNFHQLLQQRRIVIKPIHQLLLDFFKVFLGNLVKEHPQFANLSSEFGVRVFFSSIEIWSLNQLHLTFFVR